MEETKIYMSADIGELATALSTFQGKVKQPNLNKEVEVSTQKGRYRFKYADLAECVKSAKATLFECGLAVTQLVMSGKLTTMLLHKSGQWIRSEVGLGQQANAQAFGSMLTYLKRYTYCAILGLVADDDDDANKACSNIVQEIAKTPFPTTGDESLDNDLNIALQQIEKANTKEDLSVIYNSFPQLLGSTIFLSKLTERRKALGIKNSNEK